MELAIAILLILIVFVVFALFGIKEEVSHLQGSIGSLRDKGEVGEILKKIYKLMGGDLKLRDIVKKEEEDLLERLTKQILLANPIKTRKQAEEEAKNAFEHYHTDLWTGNFDFGKEKLEEWIGKSKEIVKNRNKYSHLLAKARKFIEGKKEIKQEDMEKAMKTDETGAISLLESLELEKRVKRVLYYESEYAPVKSWEVIK